MAAVPLPRVRGRQRGLQPRAPAPRPGAAGGVGAVSRRTTAHPRLWDISAPVHAGSPVFPGDTPYGQQWSASLGPGCPVNVSTITLSPHVGTHADAPLHYDNAGAAVGVLPLHAFIGPCRVIHAMGCGPLVEWRHIAHAATADLPPRVLLRTYERAPIDCWDANLPALDPDTVERLADAGVLLVGIDSASVDPASSKQLPSHQVLRRRGLRVLENLVLDAVPEGDYELIALPLKLFTADASPVRAVLRAL
ncbi:MAG: arylformamidase [Proteobacteria bacterium]|nr:arylformamidase [Pseudomonadota bacterium]